MTGERFVAGVRLSNPDKVLYAEQGITKSDLADYYAAVADRILPHVARRPITMVRCPTGQGKKCFYQRHAGSGVPEQLGEVLIPGFDEPYLYIKDLPGLIAMVQMGVLEMHPWAVTVERPDRADRIVFDLDPDEGLGFEEVREAALIVREGFRTVDLESFAMLSGGKGVHVVVPLIPRAEWPAVRGFTELFCATLAEAQPQRFTVALPKAERAGRIFLDYLRNHRTATAVLPYSVRARPGAPVAAPVAWRELDRVEGPAQYTIADAAGLIRRAKSRALEGWGEADQVLPG